MNQINALLQTTPYHTDSLLTMFDLHRSMGEHAQVCPIPTRSGRPGKFLPHIAENSVLCGICSWVMPPLQQKWLWLRVRQFAVDLQGVIVYASGCRRTRCCRWRCMHTNRCRAALIWGSHGSKS